MSSDLHGTSSTFFKSTTMEDIYRLGDPGNAPGGACYLNLAEDGPCLMSFMCFNVIVCDYLYFRHLSFEGVQGSLGDDVGLASMDPLVPNAVNCGAPSLICIHIRCGFVCWRARGLLRGG